MKQKKKILSAYKRKIHIDGKEWTYQVRDTYSHGYVKVCSPDRTKKWSFKVGQLGTVYEEKDYDYFVPIWSNNMTPADVRRLIEKRILGLKIPR